MKKLLIAVAVALNSLLPVQATTIAYDGRYLAADSQVTCTSGTKLLNASKITICKEKHVAMACAGSCKDIQKFLDFYLKGKELPAPAPSLMGDDGLDFEALIVDYQTGDVIDYVGDSTGIAISSVPYAFGAGRAAAAAVLVLNFDAVRAVAVAREVNAYTGGKVLYFDIKHPEHGLQKSSTGILPSDEPVSITPAINFQYAPYYIYNVDGSFSPYTPNSI